jgi:hypothetical protein
MPRMTNDIRWQEVFSEKEWQEIVLSDKENVKVDLIISSSYAIVGWIFDKELSRAFHLWTDCQGLLLQIKNSSNDCKNKDLYVIAISEEVPKSKFKEVEKIINDTHGARKLFLEQRGRSIEETMSDTGLTSNIKRAQGLLETVDSELEKILPSKILEDLDKRHEKAILQNLLDNVYKK